MFVRCVLSGRGLCDGLITRPEESYGLCCVIACDLVTSRMRRLKLARVVNARQKKKNTGCKGHITRSTDGFTQSSFEFCYETMRPEHLAPILGQMECDS